MFFDDALEGERTQLLTELALSLIHIWDCQHHHGRRRIWERPGDSAAAGDHYRSGGLRIF